MKIILIKPNIGIREYSKYKDNASMEPLQLGVLAALTPNDVEVKMYDDRLETIPFQEEADLIAITVETFTARRSYEISQGFKEAGNPAKVLLGGMHVTLLSEEAAAYADAIMTGDGEDKWAEMIEDLRAGKLKQRYDCQPVEAPQKGVITRRDIFQGKKYLPITLLQFSRGCRGSCRYCASSVFFNRNQYCRPVEDVVAEIKSQKRKLLFFVDDNIVADKEKAKELFRALIPLKIRWVSQGSMDMLEDDELMELMVKSGCVGNVIGFESIRADSIDIMGKGVNSRHIQDRYSWAVKRLRHWGLQTWAAFTVGHDTDTLESIEETYEFAKKNKFTFAAYNILMPYPKTPLYEQLEKEGRLLFGGKWWLHPDYRFNYASFKPRNMSHQQLTEAAFGCRKKFNSASSVIYRLFEPRTNLGSPYRFISYLIYNPLFRREVFEKQGMSFGYEEKQIDSEKQ